MKEDHIVEEKTFRNRLCIFNMSQVCQITGKDKASFDNLIL